MQEISFSIPVAGFIRVSENSITIVVNRAETTVIFEPAVKKEVRIILAKGETLFDVLLETAKKYVEANKQDRFSAAQLYHEAIRRYPDLKRNSWGAHVIASSPNHRSQKHYGTRRDYFNYLGKGMYTLNPQYRTIHKHSIEED